MPILLALIPQLVALLLPAAEHALGADAAPVDKHAWVKDAIHELFGVFLAKIKAPNWVELVRGDLEKLIDSELAKAMEKLSD